MEEKIRFDYEIKNNAVTKQEVELEFINTNIIYNSLKKHCRRKGKDIMLVFDTDQTIFKCKDKPKR